MTANRTNRIDPIAEYAFCVELAEANTAVGIAVEHRRGVIRRALDRPGVRSAIVARQLGVNRATVYRWASDPSAYDHAMQHRLPVVDGPEIVPAADELTAPAASKAKPRTRTTTVQTDWAKVRRQTLQAAKIGQLRRFAARHQIRGYSRMERADLVRAVLAAEGYADEATAQPESAGPPPTRGRGTPRSSGRSTPGRAAASTRKR